MTNEEINVLINLHIEELEQQQQDNKTKRLIKALKTATEIVKDTGKGIYTKE